jgi:uncharacterized membrane protein YhaH (DUF805 family)
VFKELQGKGCAMDWYLMVWRKYAEFDGRSQRKEYWMFALFNFFAMLVLGAIGGLGAALSDHRGVPLFIPLGIYALAGIIPTLAVATRRFHDSGKSGWMLLLLMILGLIPVIGIVTAIIQIVYLCQDSDPGVNQYGPNPKYPEQAFGMFYGNDLTTMGLSPQPQPLAGVKSDRFCTRCGARLNSAQLFCSSCGAQV